MTPVRPEPLPRTPAVLGTLAPALRRLAELQGAWPPRPPACPRDVVVPSGGSRATGQAAADAAADEGVDLLLLDDDGDPAAGLAALAALLDVEPVAAVGTTGGPGWAGQVAAVRSALPRLRPLLGDPASLLDAVGDPRLAHLVGVVEQAALRRTPVLLGSAPGAVGAALLADRLVPGASSWLLAGSSGSAPAAQRALVALGLVPVLDLRLPGPGGALLADRLLRAALELLDGPERA